MELQPIPDEVTAPNLSLWHSPELAELAAALAKAQGEMAPATKDAEGNYGTYATLVSTTKTALPVLSSNGLSIVQGTDVQGDDCIVSTLLLHSSGQWIRARSSCHLAQQDAQRVGSATTYLRRYSLMAMVGLAAEDDDGQGATDATRDQPRQAKPRGRREIAPPVPEGPISEDDIAELQATCTFAGVDYAKFLEWAQVPDWADLRMEKMPIYRNKLQKTLEKAGRKDGQ